MSLKILEPEPGDCQICARHHNPTLPHDIHSLYYQIKFKLENNREATWQDAMAHCSDDMKQMWQDSMDRVQAEITKLNIIGKDDERP